MMKKLLLIVNPCSGKKKANRALPDIVGVFERGGYDVTTHMTTARGDATEVVAAKAQEFDVIVCVGGDGTFNEVISGLYASGAAAPVGYIPAGSTNDFANSLKLSKDLLQAAQDIVDGTPRPLDIGKFNDRYFSYIASFGAFTRASYATSQRLKNALGHFAYLLRGVREAFAIRSRRLRVKLSDGTVYEDDYIFGGVSNSTSFAGVLKLKEDMVDMGDGRFEVLLIRKPRNPAEFARCVHALLRQKYDTPMLTLSASDRVEVDAPADMDWTLDGEKAEGTAHYVIENLHHAVNVITNAK